jgi:hypothetical protein
MRIKWDNSAERSGSFSWETRPPAVVPQAKDDHRVNAVVGITDPLVGSLPRPWATYKED